MPTRLLDTFLLSVMPRPDSATMTVDLRELRWVSPTAVVAIAALAHQRVRCGGSFALRAPVREDPASYVARMRLGGLLDSLGAEHDLPTVAERDQRANLLEVTQVRSDSDADSLAALVFGKLRRRDRTLATALHRSVGEIGANVADHARAVGFVAAQTMPRRDELTLAVADCGVGLLHTLAHRGAADDAQAIDLAVLPSVSRFDDPDRGLGLPTTLEAVRALSGSLYIASGSASVRHEPRRRRFQYAARPFPGTIVEARVPLAAPLHPC